MKILIVSDAWKPQINGVVRTLEALEKAIKELGHEVFIVGAEPARLFSFPMPGYEEITLEFLAGKRLLDILNNYKPDIVHIATEGPLGLAMRRICLKRRIPFTTAYHSRFPEYVESRTPAILAPMAKRICYSYLRWFHAPSPSVLVATKSTENDLRKRGFKNLALWKRGVNTGLFRPRGKKFPLYEGMERPILLYVGRIAREKNLPAFLELKTSGSKVLIGQGPDMENLRSQYPDACFLGSLEGKALAYAYSAADLFVFPSKTDTFGLVLLEACASGLRIAAFPASGPLDIFSTEESRLFCALNDDLQKAVDTALNLPDKPEIPRRFAEKFSWQECAKEFLDMANYAIPFSMDSGSM